MSKRDANGDSPEVAEPGGCVRQFFEGELHSEFRVEGDAKPTAPGEASWALVGGRPARSRHGVVGPLLAPFLPKGYPDSVTPDYASFQVWDTAQALCSYVRGMLCHKAMLTGIGVGKEAATPLGALFHFFMRDFVGMLGGIVFAYCQGSLLDSHAKQWRLFADCINNVGLALELASPLFPTQFLLMACLGSIARALCGVAAGATRAAMTQHFALARNAADIAAKEGSQETATTLLGMIAGMAVTHLVADIPVAAWATFGVLTALHVYCNVRAVRSLCLRSLNQPRVEALVAHFIATGEILSPERLNASEPLAVPPLRRLARRLRGLPVADVCLGTPVAEMVHSAGIDSLLALKSAQGGDAQGAIARQLHLLSLRRNGGILDVVLHRRATDWDVLLAFTHAVAAMCSANGCGCLIPKGSAQTTGRRGSKVVPVEAALREAEEWMGAGEALRLVGGLEAAGWDMSRISLPAGPWRAEWPAAYLVSSAGGLDPKMD